MRLNNTRVPGTGLMVHSNLRIDNEDISGETSATDLSEKGFKPKTLSVLVYINYSDPKDLTLLLGLAEAVDRDGKQVVYSVVEPVAEAMNIRQVKFTENFKVNEEFRLRRWLIRFELVEHLSVPEKKEQRKEPQSPQAQSLIGDINAINPLVSMFDDVLENLGKSLP